MSIVTSTNAQEQKPSERVAIYSHLLEGIRSGEKERRKVLEAWRARLLDLREQLRANDSQIEQHRQLAALCSSLGEKGELVIDNAPEGMPPEMPMSMLKETSRILADEIADCESGIKHMEDQCEGQCRLGKETGLKLGVAKLELLAVEGLKSNERLVGAWHELIEAIREAQRISGEYDEVFQREYKNHWLDVGEKDPRFITSTSDDQAKHTLPDYARKTIDVGELQGFMRQGGKIFIVNPDARDAYTGATSHLAPTAFLTPDWKSMDSSLKVGISTLK